MTDEERRPLSELTPPSTAQSQADRESEFEGLIVVKLCVRYKIPAITRKQMWTVIKDRSGTGRLSLPVWHEFFPSFPVYLGVAVITHLPKDCTISKLFMDFGNRKFIPAYQRVCESVPDGDAGQPVGLVFRWPHLTGTGDAPTGLIVHNRGWSANVSGVRISWTPPNTPEGIGGEKLCIEHFDTFLNGIDADAVGRKWAPSTDG